MNRPVPPPAPSPSAPSPTGQHALAFAVGTGAYVVWGVVGLFFKYVTVDHQVAPFTLLAHRVVWSLGFVLIVLAATRQLGAFAGALRSRRLLIGLLASSLLIAVNWITFIYAAATGRLVAASLGYFLSPIMNVVLGVVLLRERLRPGQRLAVLLAGAGVAALVYQKASAFWIPATLTISWSFYVLLRKRIAIGPIAGLGVETALLLPPAVVYIAYAQGYAGQTIAPPAYALLVAAGVITAVPLMAFAYAARRLRMITLGLMQYVGPTMQFLVGWWIAGEVVTRPELASFAIIWVGLIAFSIDSYAGFRRPTTPMPPAD